MDSDTLNTLSIILGGFCFIWLPFVYYVTREGYSIKQIDLPKIMKRLIT
jgi:hypothetical protein